MFKHILTASDGSDWALKGVNVAIDMAASLGARLSIVHASEPNPNYLFGDGIISVTQFSETARALELRAQDLFDELDILAKQRNVNPDYIYVANSYGSAAIDAKAGELGCDLIVIGSRGRRGLTKLFLGSQAAEVLAGTNLPVLIVK